jgi:hypothetical protein
VPIQQTRTNFFAVGWWSGEAWRIKHRLFRTEIRRRPLGTKPNRNKYEALYQRWREVAPSKKQRWSSQVALLMLLRKKKTPGK